MPSQTWISSKEIFIYLVAVCTGLFISGYSIHMLVGGLVSEATEHIIIGVVCGLMAIVIGFMAYDVKKRRQEQG